MPDEFIQFGLCVRGDKGLIHLSDAGLDVFRAFIMKLMEQAQRGEDAARAMGKVPGNDWSVKQAAYFKAAKSFLAGRLIGQLAPQMNLRSQLVEAHSWRSMNAIPDRWSEAIAEAAQEEQANGVGNPTPSGGGSSSDGDARGYPLDGGSNGTGGPPPAPAGGEGDNRTAGASKDGGKTANRTRKK